MCKPESRQDNNMDPAERRSIIARNVLSTIAGLLCMLHASQSIPGLPKVPNFELGEYPLLMAMLAMQAMPALSFGISSLRSAYEDWRCPQKDSPGIKARSKDLLKNYNAQVFVTTLVYTLGTKLLN